MVAFQGMEVAKKKCLILDDIALVVEEATNINPLSCCTSKGRAEESFAKQLFYFLATNNTHHSFDFIGEYINGNAKKNKSHDIVSYSKKKIENIIYKTERKRIMDDKPLYDVIQKCMNKLIFDGMPVRGSITPETLAKYYEGVVQF